MLDAHIAARAVVAAAISPSDSPHLWAGRHEDLP